MITLIIIGVVAAISIPTFLAKQMRMDLQAAFKSTYSTVANAYALMAHEQEVDSYCRTTGSTATFVEDFAKYVKTPYYSSKDTQNLLNTGIVNGRDLGYKVNGFKNSYGGRFDSNAHNEGFIMLENGAIIFNGGCWFSSRISLLIDTNGAKGPNKVGYDAFVLPLKSGKVMPEGRFDGVNHAGHFPSDKVNEEYCNFASEPDVFNTTSNGATCAYWALLDRYPGHPEKAYWTNLP